MNGVCENCGFAILNSGGCGCVIASSKETKELAAENLRLREALVYYADPLNYVTGDVPGHIYIFDDNGRTARAALRMNS